MRSNATRLAALGLMCLALLASPSSAQAPESSPPAAPEEAPKGAPVRLGDRELFTVYDRLGAFTPEERAAAIGERLSRLARDPLLALDSVDAVDREGVSEVVIGDTVLMAVTDGDARPLGRSRADVAEEYARRIRHALGERRQETTPRALLAGVLLALLETVVLVVLLVLFRRGFPKLYARIDSWRGTLIRPLRIQRVEVLSADKLARGLIGVARGLRVAATLLALYVFVTTVLGIFPWTRGLSTQLFEPVVATLRAVGVAFLTHVPNILSIAVIVVVTRYIIKLIHVFFNGIEAGAITFAGFHRDWAQPTYKIVRFLVIVFAAVAVFPYVPGSKSPAFQGISVFLGVLFSLGSAGAISNVIAGVVLTYMRPFQVGDRVKIADTVGDVVEKTLLVTRVRTIKNVDITIPNAMVLGSHLVNYSSSATDRGLILHTRVTIGYDAPWRKVHELLIAAARGTTHVLQRPEPFVLQTSLDDFYVTYELNAFTDRPNLMATIYAELHQNIQDRFNEAGVEIMSPHYTQLRDGNRATIPEPYLPKGYQAPGLRILQLGQVPARVDDASSAEKAGA